MVKVVILGGAMDPAGLHHAVMARQLSRHFDKVVVFPCGPDRLDKSTVNDTPLIHRAVMSDMAFGRMPKVEVDLSDLEQERFTRDWEFEQRFRHLGQVWIAIGSDYLVRGSDGVLPIMKWDKGQELWRKGRFVIFQRPGYEVNPKDLPARHRIFPTELDGSSTEIREAYREHHQNSKVHPDIHAYIQRYGLYRSAAPKFTGALYIPNPRLLIVWERRHPNARAIYAQLEKFQNRRRPNAILVIGGDGTMLSAIRKYWRLRLPFIGLNTGRAGVLLSDPGRKSVANIFRKPLTVHNLPLLYVEADKTDGSTIQALAFNDTWVERATGQTASVEISLDGTVRVKELRCDSVLVATAAGSPAYAKQMGAIPFKFDVQALALAASCVSKPVWWRPKNLPIESRIEFRNLDPNKRPLRAMVDSVDEGLVTAMRIRTSRIANAQLAFLPGYSFDDKLIAQQFEDFD